MTPCVDPQAQEWQVEDPCAWGLVVGKHARSELYKAMKNEGMFMTRNVMREEPPLFFSSSSLIIAFPLLPPCFLLFSPSPVAAAAAAAATRDYIKHWHSGSSVRQNNKALMPRSNPDRLVITRITFWAAFA